MDFADYLDEIARPADVYERSPGGAGPMVSSPFWEVLERVASTTPVARTVVDEAYFAVDRDAGHSGPALPAPPASELSLDPDDIADELDLDGVSSIEALSVLRRRFARLNHPDRMPEALKSGAHIRMTIANAMIDAAAARLSA